MSFASFALVFLLGASLGSFVNVILARFGGTKIKLNLSDRSRCDTCKKELTAWELIPVVSFFVLGGKCRHCHKPIAPKHLYFELFMGFLAAGVFYLNNQIYDLPSLYIIAISALDILVISSLLVVAGIDWQEKLVIEPVVIAGAAVAAVKQLILISLGLTSWQLVGFGVLAGAILFIFLVVVSREKWMGIGDIEIGALLGLWLGFPIVLVALFLSFITGAFYGIYLIASGNAKRGDQVPFVPFLVLGSLIALFFGENMINWYLR